MAPRFLLLCALFVGAPAAALAQTEEPVTLGPPELRSFELPGTRTTPAAPAAEPPPAAARPTPTPSPAASPAREPQRRERAQTPQPRPSPAPSRAEIEDRGRRVPPAAAPERQQREASPAPDTATAPTISTLPDTLPEVAPALPQPSGPMPATPLPEPSAEEPGGGAGWIAAVLAVLAGLAARFFVRRRRSQAAEAAAAAERQRIALDRRTAPAPPVTPAQPDARIELEFRPQRVVISEGKAEINFKLTIRNAGALAAEDVRIAVKTFNAADKAGLESYLAEKVLERGPMQWRMPAGYEENLEGIGKLEGDEIRAVEVQGRRLLIPVVAFNIVWRLADGRSGQTALSYLVGRESDPPSEKMGAFRLDLGPRLYRTVGQRANRPAAPKSPKKVRVRIEA